MIPADTIPARLGSARFNPARRDAVEQPGPVLPAMWNVAESDAPPIELGIAAAILLVVVVLSPLL